MSNSAELAGGCKGSPTATFVPLPTILIDEASLLQKISINVLLALEWEASFHDLYALGLAV